MKKYRIYEIKKDTTWGRELESPPSIGLLQSSDNAFEDIDEARNYPGKKSLEHYIILDCHTLKVIYSYP